MKYKTDMCTLSLVYLKIKLIYSKDEEISTINSSVILNCVY